MTTAPEPSSQTETRPLRKRMRMMLGAAFAAALALPMLGTIFHWDPAPSYENRAMALMPGWPHGFAEARVFADRFMSYYRDNFGFRNTMIRAVALGEYHGGVGLQNNANVLIGKQGWLYLPLGDENFLAFRGLNPMSEGELEQWRRLLESRRGWCRSRGIQFVVVIPPDKQTIYPEHLPDQFARRFGESRLDQLIGYLQKQNSPVDLVDLRRALFSAKRERQIYYTTDSHWNNFGAYVGYRALIAEVQKVLPGREIPVPGLDQFSAATVTYVGDLAKDLDLYYEYQEQATMLTPRGGFTYFTAMVDKKERDYADGPDRAAPRMVMYSDSFAAALIPYLAASFSHAYFRWGDSNDLAIAQREKADVVIDEFVERKLCGPPPVDGPGESNPIEKWTEVTVSRHR